MSRPAAVKKENAYADATPAQVRFAESLAVKAGYPRAYALSAARRDYRGKNPVGAMKRQECSELIGWLQARAS